MGFRERAQGVLRRVEDRRWFVLAKGTVQDFAEDKALRLSAALAYYTLFSLAPLIVIAIAIAGLAFGEEAARGHLLGGLSRLLGEEGGAALQLMVANAYRPGTGVVATVLGIAALLFGATGVVAQLKDALNTIWEVEPRKGRGVMRVLRDRVLSLGMVMGIGFLLLVSLAASAIITALADLVRAYLPGSELVYLALQFVIAVVMTTAAFALLFRFVPDAKVSWRDVWLGGFATALLFNVGQLAISLYLARASVAGAYGAAGSLVIILLWVFYSATIFFVGAEFTQVYANRYGSRVRPDAGAKPATEEARAQQGMPARRERRGRDAR